MLDRIKSNTHNFPEYHFTKELLLIVSSFTYCEHAKSESNVLLYATAASSASSASSSASIDDSNSNERGASDKEVSGNLVVSSDDEDNVSDEEDNDDNNDDEDDLETIFLHDAQDIQNQTSRVVRTAAMEDRRFRELFGANIGIVLHVWHAMEEGGLLPNKSKPKHLLWTLYFLKVYPQEAPGCSSVGGGGGGQSTPKHCKNGCGSSSSASLSWQTMW